MPRTWVKPDVVVGDMTTAELRSGLSGRYLAGAFEGKEQLGDWVLFPAPSYSLKDTAAVLQRGKERVLLQHTAVALEELLRRLTELEDNLSQLSNGAPRLMENELARQGVHA